MAKWQSDFIIKDDGAILLIATNPKYAPVEVKGKDARLRCFKITIRIKKL